MKALAREWMDLFRKEKELMERGQEIYGEGIVNEELEEIVAEVDQGRARQHRIALMIINTEKN